MTIQKLSQLLFFVAVMLLSACSSTKHIAYLEGAEYIPEQQLVDAKQQFTALIKPNDLLKIVVCGSEEMEAYIPFNLYQAIPATETTVTTQPGLLNYVVDKNGQISFPVLGKITVANLSSDAAAAMITEKLKPYLKGNTIVTVHFADYKVSVLGEVNRPGTFPVKDEKVSLFQALSMAGDLTIYGRREVVKVIREDADGQKTIATLNINDKNLVFSPYFYLQQGDVVYVEPNKTKAKGSDIGAATSTTISIVSVLIGVASLIVTIAK